MHIKRTVANAFALSAFLHVMPAMAGDTWDAYFLIVASIKAKTLLGIPHPRTPFGYCRFTR